MLDSGFAPIRQLFRHLLLVCSAAVLLAACQTVPSTHTRLSEAQIAGLRQAGFAETDEGWSLNLSGSILFDTDTDRITVNAEQLISEVHQALRSIDIDSVRVEGHTDSTGNSAYNYDLSARRAEAVARKFVRLGMAENQVVRRSFGSDRPIADNASSAGRAQNRRVAIIVPAY